jgi:hypothetical protein
MPTKRDVDFGQSYLLFRSGMLLRDFSEQWNLHVVKMGEFDDRDHHAHDLNFSKRFDPFPAKCS